MPGPTALSERKEEGGEEEEGMEERKRGREGGLTDGAGGTEQDMTGRQVTWRDVTDVT